MRIDRRFVRVAVASAVALAFGASVSAQEITGGATTSAKPMSKNLIPITQPMLNAAAGDPKNWIHSNGSYEQTRYYPGSQINTANVGKLAPKFVFQTAVLESMETAPIVVNGVMFLTTSFNHVYAIDAKTGDKVWSASRKAYRACYSTPTIRAHWARLGAPGCQSRPWTICARSLMGSTRPPSRPP